MEIKKVFVMGSGQMGAGIAQVSAQAGFETVMCDITQEILDNATGKIKKSLEKQEGKGRLEKGKAVEIMNRLTSTTDKNAAADCGAFIEAAPEIEELKKNIFKDADAICPKDALLISNTSAISITEIGNATKRPEQVVGMHFMNPVPVMKLVEIIRGHLTSDETYQRTLNLGVSFGKEVITAKDFPGFVSTRLCIPLMNEALYQVYDGMATMEDIDKCAKLALNHPMGPFEWMDFVGLDSLLSIMENLFEAFNEQKYFPCPLIKKMVQVGHLGRKTGRGFYDYTK